MSLRNKDFRMQFMLFAAVCWAFIFFSNGLFAKAESKNIHYYTAKISTSSESANSMYDNLIFCEDDENDDDDFFLIKRKVCPSVFENFSNTIQLNPLSLNASEHGLSLRFTSSNVLFHILHSNFRI